MNQGNLLILTQSGHVCGFFLFSLVTFSFSLFINGPNNYPPDSLNSRHLLIMSAAGWIRVASGFRLVASAASKIVAKEGANGAAKLTRHGVDLANNARTAAKAAGVVLPSQMPPQMGRNNTFVPNTHINSAISEPVASSGLEQSADPVEHISNATKAQNARAPDEESNHLESEISMDGESIPKTQQQLNDSNPTLLQEGRAVPSTRIGRAAGFASLGVGLAAGTMFEAASRLVGGSSSESVVANDANADRLAKTLCRMRGAALKLGQMLSIQDATLLPAPLARALEQVRQGADAMPSYQLHEQLKVELGQDWKNRFDSFQDLPFAAASIGQVHRATIDQDGVKRQVVVKVQYPGVADSIDSDLSNLTMLVKYSGFAPPGLFIDRVIDVGRDELKVECDYKREAVNQERLRDLVHGDADLSKAKFRIPAVFTNHSTKGILTSEFCPGGTIDKVAFLDQEERNRIGRNIMRLTVKELFTWRFMQTDPNVSFNTACFSLHCFLTTDLTSPPNPFDSGATFCTMLGLEQHISLILARRVNIVNPLLTGIYELSGLVQITILKL